MKRLLCLTAGVLGLTCAAWGRQPPPPATAVVSLRIGTWNIEWLGQPSKRKLPPQDPADLAAVIGATGVDVLGLNEISINDGPTDGAGTNTILTAALAKLSADAGGEWQHMVFPKEDPADRDQCVGVAWNAKKVTLVGRPFRVPVRQVAGRPPIWTRHPVAAMFSAGAGKTDFVLVPIHMKSNRGGEDTTRQQRSAEALALGRALAAVQNHFHDDDVILLGDFNALKHDEPALTKLAAFGFRDLNAGDAKSWIRSGPFDYAAFDRLLVPDDQPEFRNARQRVFKEVPFGSEAEYRKRCSDHYPTFMDIVVMDDDD